ncbi:MAG TPA: MoaD/ThiS family protein [Planctomycetota bacterium]
MPSLHFTPQLERFLPAPPAEVQASTVRAALEEVFRDNPALRGYVLDDQGALRKHVAVFVDGRRLRDKRGLGDALQPDSEIYVMQALSGG